MANPGASDGMGDGEDFVSQNDHDLLIALHVKMQHVIEGQGELRAAIAAMNGTISDKTHGLRGEMQVALGQLDCARHTATMNEHDKSLASLDQRIGTVERSVNGAGAWLARVGAGVAVAIAIAVLILVVRAGALS